MTSKTTIYRTEHPEWREQEKVRDRERFKLLYQENTEHREKVKQRALARYYRIKEERKNIPILIS